MACKLLTSNQVNPVHELRQAWRRILKSPLLSISIVAVLAVAIGANTAILSALESLVFRQVPWPGGDRIVVVWEANKAQGIDREGVSGRTFMDWRQQSQLFESLALVEVGTGTLTGFGEPMQVPGLRVSASFFELTGAKPARGRLFTQQDAGGAAFAPVAVLTWDSWQRMLGAGEDAVGRTVMADLIPMTVIGVLDRSFWSPVACDAIVLWPDAFLERTRRSQRQFAVFGRLKPGVTPAQAREELDAISAAANDPRMRGWTTNVAPLGDVMSESLRPSLWALLAGALLMLLAGCANIANLLLARAVARRQETSVRLALGADRWRLARLFLTESWLLGLAGAASGVLVADALLTVATRLLPQTVALAHGSGEVLLRPIQISWPVLVAAIVLACGTALLFGLAPLWESLRLDLRSALIETSRGTSGRQGWLRPALVGVQVAFTLVLLGAAGLMVRSFLRLQNENLGFARDRILTFAIELPTDSRYREVDKVRQFYRELQRRLSETPGVESAGFINVLPLTAAQDHTQFRLEKGPVQAAQESLGASFRAVTPGYFETLRIPVRRGRPILASDTADRAAVVWIDETLERRHFAGRNPLGERILLGDRPFEIVGVVAAAKDDVLGHRVMPTLFFAHEQMAMPRMDIAVRTTGEPSALLRAMKETVWSIDKDVPVYRVATLAELFAGSTRNLRLVMLLTGVFAGAALLLAALGIYAMAAYQAETRLRELSIRLAMGAQPLSLAAMMLRQVVLIAACGVTAGLAAGWFAWRFLEPVLYSSPGFDAWTISAAAALVLLVACAAALRPAWRASHTDVAHHLGSTN